MRLRAFRIPTAAGMPHSRKRRRVLKNRAFLDDESGDSGEQRRKMRMEDA